MIILEGKEGGILYPEKAATGARVMWAKDLGLSTHQSLTPSSASHWLCGLGHQLKLPLLKKWR